jgi:general secretion pathway protein G
MIQDSRFKIQERFKKSIKGFTLIELLIVIAIIGVLATLLMVNFVGVRQRARDAQRKSDLRQIQSALEIYRSDNAIYPTSTTVGSTSILLANCGNPQLSLGNPGCTTVYMQKIPVDPSSSSSIYNQGKYYYSSAGYTYTLGACLENGGDSQGTATPGGSGTCTSGKYFVVNNP